ncbi:MAG: NADH:ubiquinone reductase (Na(+)-transporting) subunit C [Bacteroidetes bacterium CG23_combo_of_CG06-09_8_20_14_all_32_9]|nr:MAG: NADH:ubiquinone reductase (Na(+)-transporting) subunit C [Bacteroidetes bacterium CG23_combo_of_CG06-09_8_20_14_all_32_9]
MHSNKYIFLYSSAMVILVAVALTVVAVQLKPAQKNNIRIEKMQNILAAANINSTTKDAEILFKKFITEDVVVNSKGEIINGEQAFPVNLELETKKPPEKRLLPVFICTKENGEKNYIVPLRGKGLWGPIWGYVAFKKDFNTIAGAMFDHKSETPGLGAEINTSAFRQQFKEKQIFDALGKYMPVRTVKGGAKKNDLHGVDAITGGTLTSNGLSNMLQDGLSVYVEYFNKQKK